jgi:hypothetical protein
VFSVPFEEAKCEQGVKKQVTHKVTLNTAHFKFINFSNIKFFLLMTVAYFVILLPEIPFLSEPFSEKNAITLSLTVPNMEAGYCLESREMRLMWGREARASPAFQKRR